MTEFEVKPKVSIPDGKHTGKIAEIKYRTDPYDYTDVHVKLDDMDITLTYGCPSNVGEDTKLGRLLKVFDDKMKIGDKVDPEKILVGKECEFMTQNKKKEGKGTFANIVEDSIKPKGE